MDFFSIIIDRVGTTNVFNIVQGRLPTRDTHLQTIVDDDLIQEFLGEIERISRISNSITAEDAALLPMDIDGELKRIGETFFLQFFPEQIQERLRNVRSGFLFLHVDYRLRNIPWELLYDGNYFLVEKLFIGKNIAGYWRDVLRPERDRLRVLIVADPTEDLEWARMEGEGLFESLNAELSADRLDVQFMSGRRITKLNLLNAVKDRDIIHYSGHLHYSPDQQESGWLLSGNKVLRAREIEKAGFSPYLVFSNSCLSSPVTQLNPNDNREGEQGTRFNDLAGAFLKAGISNYIGTNWEIKDNNQTYDFALQFYRAIFEEKSVGEALFEARAHARKTYPNYDLTWANYVMHGNPMTRIYRSAHRRTFDASRNELNAKKVLNTYPMLIAQGYRDFTEATNREETARVCLESIMRTFEYTLLTVGAIIFGNYRFLSLKGTLPDPGDQMPISVWIDRVYQCIRNIRSLNLELAGHGLLECMYLHRDQIQKMNIWVEQMESGQLNEDAFPTHVVTFQYLFDNLLSDLSSIGRIKLMYVFPNGEDASILHGIEPEHNRLVAPEFRESVMMELLDRNRGTICFHDETKRILYSLKDIMEFDPLNNHISFPAFQAGKILE